MKNILIIGGAGYIGTVLTDYFLSNTMGITSGADTAYPSGTPEFTPGF